MKTRDEIYSVLELGWNTSRRAWQLLAPEYRSAFSLAKIGTIGRDLDQLAYDLRRLGYDKPARMAYSVAFVVNGFSGEVIPFNHDLADKASQIVSSMAEMLLELEAKQEITVKEPEEIVEHLKVAWGLVIYAESESPTRAPKPHFKSNRERRASEQVLCGLIQTSEQLVDATESLMGKVHSLCDFPFSPAVSRIQHLATTILNQLQRQGVDQKSETVNASSNPEPTVSESQNNAIETAKPPIDVPIQTPIAAESKVDEIPSPVYRNTIPSILAIDESPFFRMLLTSAVESCGYSIHVVPTLDEAIKTCDQMDWSMVVCGGSEAISQFQPLQDWLVGSPSENTQIVILTTPGIEPAPAIPGCHHIRRTDISGLMSLMTRLLGVSPREKRMIA